MSATYTLHCGDCVDVMKDMEDESIDLTVTSPPYDNLRKYKGFSFDFETTASELYRVTKTNGVLVWVVGDETIDGGETLNSFSQALFFKKIGFAIETMIYHKNSSTPNHLQPRYDQCFEYMFVCVKGNKAKTFNPLMKENKLAGIKRKPAAKMQRDGVSRVYGKNSASEYGEYSKMPNVWTYNTGGATGDDKMSFEHPAPFPEDLAQDHILSWSNEGDTVFDPMCGSGTVGKMAVLNNRNFIGSDVSAEYVELSRRRIEKALQQIPLGI